MPCKNRSWYGSSLEVRIQCREDLFKDMMSEREDVAAKRARCMAAQGAFKEALAALEVLPKLLLTLASALDLH